MDVLTFTAHSDGGRSSEKKWVHKSGIQKNKKIKKSIWGTGTLRQQKSMEANMELTFKGLYRLGCRVCQW